MARTKVDYRKAERAYRGLFGIFIFLLIVVLALVGFFYVFLVRTIKIEGNERYTDDELIQMSGLPYEESMFLIDKKQITENMQISPFIEVEDITRIWPFTVRITVYEREPVAVTDYYGERLILDAKGNVLSRDGIYYQDQLVEVTGWEISDVILGEKLGTVENGLINSYASVMTKLDEYDLSSQVVNMDIQNLLDIELEMDDGLLVKLGDSTNLEEKMIWLSQMVVELEKEGYEGGILDLSSGTTAVYRPQTN